MGCDMFFTTTEFSTWPIAEFTVEKSYQDRAFGKQLRLSTNMRATKRASRFAIASAGRSTSSSTV
jgi:hypothetical protein